jgi:hypothetical protein
MNTKLSDLVKSVQAINRKAEVNYSWHLAGGNVKRKAFCLSISPEALKLCRFREGDGAEIEITGTEVIILLGEKLPFSCNIRSKTCGRRQIKVSASGVENLLAVLPDEGRPTDLDVIQIEVGKIRVRLPVNSQV